MIDAPAVTQVATLVPQHAFMWFCSAMTGGLAAWWFVMDALRMRSHLRALAAAKAAGKSDATSLALLHDQIFGSTIGMIIGVIGVVGVTLFLR